MPLELLPIYALHIPAGFLATLHRLSTPVLGFVCLHWGYPRI